MNRLREAIFNGGADVTAYVALDGASVDGLLGKLQELNPEHRCLYRGELTDGLEHAAPYLVELRQEHPFTEYVLTEGWGRHWGIFILGASSSDIDMLRRHLRKLNVVHSPDGKRALFRYYDPRVLRLFLPTCDGEQVDAFFGVNVRAFVCEDENPQALLRIERAPATGLAVTNTLTVGGEQ